MTNSIIGITPRQVNDAVIRHLEMWLEKAKAGNVTSIAIAGVITNRTIGMTHTFGESGLEQFALVGALSELARGVAQASPEGAF